MEKIGKSHLTALFTTGAVYGGAGVLLLSIIGYALDLWGLYQMFDKYFLFIVAIILLGFGVYIVTFSVTYALYTFVIDPINAFLEKRKQREKYIEKERSRTIGDMTLKDALNYISDQTVFGNTLEGDKNYRKMICIKLLEELKAGNIRLYAAEAGGINHKLFIYSHASPPRVTFVNHVSYNDFIVDMLVIDKEKTYSHFTVVSDEIKKVFKTK